MNHVQEWYDFCKKHSIEIHEKKTIIMGNMMCPPYVDPVSKIVYYAGI